MRDGAIYPSLADLRSISRAIAVAVAREAREAGDGQVADGATPESLVDAATWVPAYLPVVA
jgi:hypothetical protein